MYIPSSGKLYSFGLGANGQLGLGSCSKHSSPMPIPGPFVAHSKLINNKNGGGSNDQKSDASIAVQNNGVQFVVQQLFTGGDHCFALVNSSQVREIIKHFKF